MSVELDKWEPFRQRIAFGSALLGSCWCVLLLAAELSVRTVLVGALLALGVVASVASFGPYDLRRKYLLMWVGAALWIVGGLIAKSFRVHVS